ncbi:MAG: L-ribulose-5-phosphate 4-epimerase AraD [Treponema sp.]|nr:L-ribulose-5-phosphate 4-epimerase AraD [Treponema sp.]
MFVYKRLRDEAYEANMEIRRRNLALYTWGNSSAFDPDMGVFAIKPSGVDYDQLTPASMVLLDLEGNIIEGKLKPSSDTKTHQVLYKYFSSLRGELRCMPCGITHTHSTFAVAWAQAGKPVPVFGTTHADHGTENILCTEFMSAEAVKNNYEQETGNLIIDTIKKNNYDPSQSNMILVAGHGPFTWGKSAAQSVYNSVVLEEICKMAFLTFTIDPHTKPLPDHLIKKHWERKHGDNAYYGQE